MALETVKAAGTGRRRRLLVAAVLLPFLLLAIGCGGWALYLRSRRLELEERLSQLRAEARAVHEEVSKDENALTLYRRAFKLHREEALLGELLELWMEQREEFDFRSPSVRRYVEANGAFFAALQRAAARAKFTYHEDGWKPALEGRHSGFTRAVDFAIIATGHASATGQVEQALQIQELMLWIGRHMGSDGELLDILMRCGAQGRAAIGLQRILNECSPRSERLKKTLTALETELKQEAGFARAVRLSRLSQMTIYAKALHGQPVPELHDDATLKQYMMIQRWTGRGYDELREMDRVYTEASELAGKPLPQMLKEIEDLGATLLGTSLNSPASDRMVFGHFTTSMSLSALAKCLGAVASRRARLQAARLGIGCRLFKLKTGAYPENLLQLKAQFPNHFKALPADPFTGRSYGYRRTKKGCMIWSAGRNGTDEGGDADSDVVFELKK